MVAPKDNNSKAKDFLDYLYLLLLHKILKNLNSNIDYILTYQIVCEFLFVLKIFLLNNFINYDLQILTLWGFYYSLGSI